MKNTFQNWILEKKGRIAHLILNRAEKKNSLDGLTLEELGSIARQLRDDSDIWAIVLQSSGSTFSSGVDVSMIGSMIGQDRKAYEENLRLLQSYLDEFESIAKPTIAALQGYVIGGGLILALCCDFRIAAQNAIFQLPEVKRSIGVVMGTQRITRTIGIAHTKELAMLGDPVDAERAFQMGLVNKIVTVEDLIGEANKLAERFLELPPLAVGVNKTIINKGQFMERAGQELEIESQSHLLKTADFKEAITSFFEKRQPRYKGS